MVIKILNWIFLLMFLMSVVVQYNDPDPWLWILIYGAALVVCILQAVNRLNWLVALGVALVAFIWAITLLPDVIGQVAFSDLFESYEMKSIAVEKAREMGGLLIIDAWMSVLAGVNFRKRA